MLSILTGDIQLALAIAPTLMIPLMLFGGFFLNSDNIPSWLAWFKYLSWIYYSNEFLAINQWDGVEDIECNQQTTVKD